MDAETQADRAGRELGTLAGGVSLAQAAAALPDDEHGRRWRAATPALVGLHVLAQRLADGAEDPVGRTRALALLSTHRASLASAFGADRPAEVEALVSEVERLLAGAPEGQDPQRAR